MPSRQARAAWTRDDAKSNYLTQRAEFIWHLAELANDVLADGNVAARYIAVETHSAAQKPFDQFPVWLRLDPRVARKLEQHDVLRLHKHFELDLVGVSALPGYSPDVWIETEALDDAGPTKGSILAKPRPTPVSELTTPSQGRIATFMQADGVGEIETDDGNIVRFGRSTCADFDPEVGMRVWIVAAERDSFDGQLRANLVNRTGIPEMDRLEQAHEAAERLERSVEIESELKQRFHLTELSWSSVSDLGNDAQRRLADELMRLKTEGVFLEELFELLAAISPHLFHSYLSHLSPRSDPESLAYAGAPFRAVTRFADALKSSETAPSLKHLEVGTILTYREASRFQNEPEQDTGVALLILARSRDEASLRVIEEWLHSASDEMVMGAAEVLAVEQLVVTTDRRLVQPYFDTAFRIVPSGTQAKLWTKTRGEARCAACGDRLLSVTSISSANLPTLNERLPIVTCRNCVTYFDPYFVRFDSGGQPSSLLTKDIPPDFEPYSRVGTLPQTQQVGLEQAPTFVPYSLADETLLTRIGGRPSWLQYPRFVSCPECDATMMFCMQCTDPPDGLWSGDTGMLYAFVCTSCEVVGTVVQCH